MPNVKKKKRSRCEVSAWPPAVRVLSLTRPPRPHVASGPDNETSIRATSATRPSGDHGSDPSLHVVRLRNFFVFFCCCRHPSCYFIYFFFSCSLCSSSSSSFPWNKFPIFGLMYCFCLLTADRSALEKCTHLYETHEELLKTQGLSTHSLCLV